MGRGENYHEEKNSNNPYSSSYRSNSFYNNRKCSKRRPVSYTHLDVYKRQVQDNRHQNSADAVAQQQPRRNADQTKQKCLLANDAFELPGRCANGFQKSVKPDIPRNRDLKNVIDDKIPRENHQQQKSCYGDHQLWIELRFQLG